MVDAGAVEHQHGSTRPVLDVVDHEGARLHRPSHEPSQPSNEAATYTGGGRAWEAARLTVGGVLAAVDAVLGGGIQRALVHARPAGHHAEPDRAIASTYLNNVACGVEHARARGVERVAIIDWDVHVANGAERIFWDRDDVLAISLHQQDWYPAHAGALRATGGSGAEG